MENKISLSDLLSDFQSRNIESEELESLVIEVVDREYPNDSIEDLEYTDEGISVTLASGQSIEIEIDWNEIVLV